MCQLHRQTLSATEQWGQRPVGHPADPDAGAAGGDQGRQSHLSPSIPIPVPRGWGQPAARNGGTGGGEHSTGTCAWMGEW